MYEFLHRGILNLVDYHVSLDSCEIFWCCNFFKQAKKSKIFMFEKIIQFVSVNIQIKNKNVNALSTSSPFFSLFSIFI